MTRTEAVARINDAIGFRATGNPLETKIILRLQEAQRDLEKGKTLPRFLLVEDQTLVLPAGEHAVALPTGFLRDVDDVGVRYYEPNTVRAHFLKRAYFRDAVNVTSFLTGGETLPDQPRAPRNYVIRRTTIDFVTVVTQDFTFVWDYYKADAVLTANIENLWLANAPEWLIGEAGLRIARNLGNQQAAADFDAMRTQGRAATFGETLASELSSGPLQMGGNL